MNVFEVYNFAKEKYNTWFGGYDSLIIKAGEDNNDFENYLKFFNNVPEHASTLLFIQDLIVGKGLNDNNVDIDIWTLKKIVLDYLIFGSFTIFNEKTYGGKTLKQDWLDMSKCRLDVYKENIIFHDRDIITNALIKTKYPLITNAKESGVFFFKNYLGREHYGRPFYMQSGKVLDNMFSIIEYNQDQSANGFAPTIHINIPGISDPKVLKDFEISTKTKFTGSQGQRFVLTGSNTVETKPTFDSIDNVRFDESFELLYKTLRNQIFIGSRITSSKLIGSPDEGSGFSKAEYEEALDVFKSVVISSFQIELEYALSKYLDKDVKFIIE